MGQEVFTFNPFFPPLKEIHKQNHPSWPILLRFITGKSSIPPTGLNYPIEILYLPPSPMASLPCAQCCFSKLYLRRIQHKGCFYPSYAEGTAVWGWIRNLLTSCLLSSLWTCLLNVIYPSCKPCLLYFMFVEYCCIYLQNLCSNDKGRTTVMYLHYIIYFSEHHDSWMFTEQLQYCTNQHLVALPHSQAIPRTPRTTELLREQGS